SFSNTYILGYVRYKGVDICLTPDENEAHQADHITFIDDDHVLFITNYKEEFAYVAFFDLKQKQFKPLLKLDRENVKNFRYHKPSQQVYIIAEKGVSDHLYSFSVDDPNPEFISLPIDI